MCTLQHAFNSSNLLGLVYKIVQETQPAIPDIYSTDLRALTTQLLAKDPARRPTASEIFAIPFIRARIEGLADTRGTIGQRPVPSEGSSSGGGGGGSGGSTPHERALERCVLCLGFTACLDSPLSRRCSSRVPTCLPALFCVAGSAK